MATYSELVETLAHLRHEVELADHKVTIAVERERLLLATAINQKWSSEHLQQAMRESTADVVAAYAERDTLMRNLGDLLAHAYLAGQVALTPPEAPASDGLTPRETLRRAILTQCHRADLANVQGDETVCAWAEAHIRKLVGYDGIDMDESTWPADPHLDDPISFDPDPKMVPDGDDVPCMGCGRYGCDGHCMR